MCFDTSSYAWHVTDVTATQKMVLLALAHRKNSQDERCDPSFARIAKDCCLTDRSVKEQIKALEEIGYIRVVKQIKNGVQTSNSYDIGFHLTKERMPDGKEKIVAVSPAWGVVNEVHPPSEPSSPPGVNIVHPNKEGEQRSKYSTPSLTLGVSSEKVPNLKESFDPKSYLVAKGVDEQVVKDWLVLRKKKRLDVTPTAMKGFEAQVIKAGYTLQAALEMCCLRGWAAFYASWVEKEPMPGMTAADKIKAQMKSYQPT